MVTEVKSVQFQKAPMPIIFTPSGMVIVVSLLHSEKAFMPMDITLLGIRVLMHPLISVLVSVSIIALQLSRESYLGLSEDTAIDVRPLQLLNILIIDNQQLIC